MWVTCNSRSSHSAGSSSSRNPGIKSEPMMKSQAFSHLSLRDKGDFPMYCCWRACCGRCSHSSIDGVTEFDLKSAHFNFSTVIYFLTVQENVTNFNVRNAGSHNQSSKIQHVSYIIVRKQNMVEISNVQFSCQILSLHLLMRAYNIFPNKPSDNKILENHLC